MTDLETMLRDAVARETAATVTPPFETLAFHGRHHRIRAVAVGAVAVAAALAIVIVALPRPRTAPGPAAPSLGGTPPAAAVPHLDLLPFERLAGDTTALGRVRLCMDGLGYDVPAGLWGLGTEPLPPSGRLGGSQWNAFGVDYLGCLKRHGYLVPPAMVTADRAVRCDDLLGERGIQGSELGAGSNVEALYRVQLAWTGRSQLCLLYVSAESIAFDDEQVKMAVAPPVTGSGVRSTHVLTPMREGHPGREPWLALGFAPPGTARVEVTVDGRRMPTSDVSAWPGLPEYVPFALPLILRDPPGTVLVEFLDADGRRIEAVGPYQAG